MFTIAAIDGVANSIITDYSEYNIIPKHIWDTSLQFDKLRPEVLKNFNEENKRPWIGIVWNRSGVQPSKVGNSRLMEAYEVVTPIKENELAVSANVYSCKFKSCLWYVNFVSNDIIQLEMFENDFSIKFDRMTSISVNLEPLGAFDVSVSDIEVGDLFKFPSQEFGTLVSLSYTMQLSYPVLIEKPDWNIIKEIRTRFILE